MRVSRWILWLLALLLLLHQNFWMWREDALVAGLPVNLIYHLGLCALTTVLMAFVVKREWPEPPDEE